MARVLGGALGAWVVLCGLAASGATADLNDTPAGASGPLLQGAFWGGSIGTENDVDWYVLYSGASTELGVHLSSQGPDDCFGQVMELTDGSGRFLAGYGYAINSAETQHILFTVGVGTFYVKVSPYNVSPCIGQEARYTLWATAWPQLLAAPPPTPAPPPGNTPARNTSTSPGGHGAAAPSENCLRARAWEQRLQLRQRQAHQLPPAARRRQLSSLRHRLRRAHDLVRRQC